MQSAPCVSSGFLVMYVRHSSLVRPIPASVALMGSDFGYQHRIASIGSSAGGSMRLVVPLPCVFLGTNQGIPLVDIRCIVLGL